MPNASRSKASDFDPEVLRLFDQYVHGLIDRRGFLAGAARFAVGATTPAAPGTPLARTESEPSRFAGTACRSAPAMSSTSVPAKFRIANSFCFASETPQPT